MQFIDFSLEQRLYELRRAIQIVGYGEMRPWKDFFDSLFKDKEVSKPIANTLAVNLFYYRINYVCICILLLIPFLLFKRFALFLFSCILLFGALLLGNRKRPFLPAFLSVRLLGAVGIIWIISLCFRVHWWLGLYFLLCAGITFLHAALRKVEDKSRDTYEESMLLISVNGDKNDEEDRYLNGYSTLHIKK
ncbi:hypothetical protein WA538_003114, partial [Blastocystis sp. DL]